MIGDPFGAAKTAFARHVEQNSYPGRGLVIGRAGSGDGWLQVYWIMGRSENSRNRRFVADGPLLRTEAVDPSRMRDPSLVIYEAMLERSGVYLVSNGDQTQTIAQQIDRDSSPFAFEAALLQREREPDAPNYTPRISGMLDLRAQQPRLALSIVRANEADPEHSDRHGFRPAAPPPGLGFGLTTYSGDGEPLPSFRGDPLWLPLEGDADAVLNRYWEALDADNRVALAVKRIAADGGVGELRIRNAHGPDATR